MQQSDKITIPAPTAFRAPNARMTAFFGSLLLRRTGWAILVGLACPFLLAAQSQVVEKPPLPPAMREISQQLAKGQCAEALRDLEKLEKQMLASGVRADFLLLRSRAHECLEEWPSALADVETYLDIEPRDSESHLRRGELLVELNRFEEAIAAFQRAAELRALAARKKPPTTRDSGASSPSSRPAGSCTPRSECCRVCGKGKACGNSCISTRFTCRKGRGCACNSYDIC